MQKGETTLHRCSRLHIQQHHIGSLKMAMAEYSTNKGLSPPLAPEPTVSHLSAHHRLDPYLRVKETESLRDQVNCQDLGALTLCQGLFLL